MRLLLVRHADAVKLGQAGADADSDRQLTDHGFAQARALADALASREVGLVGVVSSPFLRALQTAEPLLRLVADPAATLTVCDHLSPEDFRRKKVSKCINAHDQGCIAVVGHMPTLGAYAAWLLGAEEDAVSLEKAGCVLLELDGAVEKGKGRLVWMVTPTWFMANDTPATSG